MAIGDHDSIGRPDPEEHGCRRCLCYRLTGTPASGQEAGNQRPAIELPPHRPAKAQYRRRPARQQCGETAFDAYRGAGMLFGRHRFSNSDGSPAQGVAVGDGVRRRITEVDSAYSGHCSHSHVLVLVSAGLEL